MARKKVEKTVVETCSENLESTTAVQQDAFKSRTHTSTSVAVRLDIFSVRNDLADAKILSSLNTIGERLTEILKAEAVTMVRNANEEAMKYQEFTPGLAISHSVFAAEQVACQERDYRIVHAIATEKPVDNSAAN